jgi:DNA invertase Pin-like site-specific DNA recombinase
MEVRMESKSAWLYCRIASKSPESDFCMEAQLSSLRRFAADNGYLIAGVTCEYGAGISLNRPGLRLVTQAACNRQVDVLIIKDLSRIARGYQETAQYIDYLNQQSITLISLNDGLELSRQVLRQTEHRAKF